MFFLSISSIGLLYCAYSSDAISQALADLTGGIAMNISIKKMQADVRSGSLWKKLLEYRDAGYLMGCGACFLSGVSLH